MRKFVWSAAAVVVLLGIWKTGSVWIDAPIILPSPEAVLIRIAVLFTREGFGKTVGATLLRGAEGFVVSLTLGVLTGLLAGRFTNFRRFLTPVLTVIRTVPVMSVILLAMIWFRASNVPVFTAFLMAYPIITGNVVAGMAQRDAGLDEMASVYAISRYDRLRHIALPSILPYLLAGVQASVGLTWKVVVAAEILAQPVRAIGTGMKYAQASLETAEVLAWTVLAVVISFLSEQCISLFFARPLRQRMGASA